MFRTRTSSAVTLVGLLALLGCSTDGVGGASAATDEPAAAVTTDPAASTASTSPPTPLSTSTPTPEPTPTREPPHPVSLPALMEHEYDGRGLEVGDVLDENDAYTRYHVTYRSGELTISGIMNVPTGDGPFPVLVLAHGYIDPEIYTTGRGLAREQDYLARQGYVVLHTDYRNHAQSDDDPESEVRLRLGYTEDVVNAVLAVRESSLPYLDGERVGLLGRSMGGGVTLNTLVARPGLVDAAVIYASVSSNTVDNFNTWTRGSPDGDRIIDAYGAPDAASRFWRNLSPRTFFDRVTEPVLIHHGTADETCPIEWSYQTRDALEVSGVDVTMEVYEGEEHAFIPQWQDSIERTADFFAEHL